MNSDSIWDTEFFQEHKGLIVLFVTISFSFFSIYWLYRGLKSNNTDQQDNNLNNQNLNNLNQLLQRSIPSKKRLTINANGILFDNNEDIELSSFYQTLDALSKTYDLYIVILVNDEENTNKILEKLNPLVEDKIIFQHVLF
jgi:hypothetical protein